MEEGKYLEEIIKELKNTKKYNLKDLIYAKYQKDYKKGFFTDEHGYNKITTRMSYYGMLVKKDEAYFDIINDIIVNENELLETHNFNENIELSLEEIKNALKVLEEKFDLYVDGKILGGDYGEGSYKIIKFRATKGIEKTIEEQEKAEEYRRKIIEDYKNNSFFRSIFRK